MSHNVSRIALVALVLCSALPAAGDEPAKELELFEKEKWYQEQEGKEQVFEGEIKHVDRGGRVGFGRFNPYRLVMKDDAREIYVGGKLDILKPYIGKRVAITGKAVNLGVEGKKHREIWPARLKLIEKKKEEREPKVDGSMPVING